MDLIDRQEAIEAVRSYYDEVNTSNKSIEERIEDLPSAQPEKRTDKRTETHGVCLDVIDRQAVIDALDKLCDRECEYSKKQRSVMCGACHLGSAFDVVEQLPSVQPERKKGKWIPVTNGRGGFECEKCHHYAPSYQDGVEWLSDYCPSCGIDMREESDNERIPV